MSGSISATTLAYASLAATAVGGAVSAVGAIQQGNASSEAAKYNSEVAANNAAIATQSAHLAAAAGEAQAEQASLKTRAQVGAVKASQAAGGIDVNSGSALDVQSSSEKLGQLNALSVRSNAARTSYGYQVQATGDTAQGQLDVLEGQNAQTAGEIGAGSSVLGATSSAASNYARFLQTSSTLGNGQ